MLHACFSTLSTACFSKLQCCSVVLFKRPAWSYWNFCSIASELEASKWWCCMVFSTPPQKWYWDLRTKQAYNSLSIYKTKRYFMVAVRRPLFNTAKSETFAAPFIYYWTLRLAGGMQFNRDFMLGRADHMKSYLIGTVVILNLLSFLFLY